MFSFKDTTATQKIFKLRKRIRAVAGGTSASKTISILIWIIDYCQNKHERDKIVTVTSESLPHLRKGAILDFETIMKDRDYWNNNLWNKSTYTYTFETGNKLEFSSFDTYGKAHGARRDILFVNEGNNMAYNIVDQLITRTREIVWLDWNPTNEFWFYTDMLPNRKDIDFITLTYKDNEALDEGTIMEIESHKNNAQWWRVYGEGKLGVLEGRIYKDWGIIEDVPKEARIRRYGLDFGYTNDPTAGVGIYVHNGAFILDEVVYYKGLSNRQIADLFLNIDRALIVADCADPKSIDELRSYGLYITPSKKGKDSVIHGIQYVQGQSIFVTKRSINLLKEYRNYMWLVDKDGKTLNEPSPIWNHCFVKETKIITVNGEKNIDQILEGDYVLTSNGFNKVLSVYNNGKKRVYKYYLHIDTYIVELICTPDHLIKTNKGWIQISQLKSGMIIYLSKSLMEKNINCIQKKDTFQEVRRECTSLYGKLLMVKLLRDFIFIIKTIIHGITELKIFILLKVVNIYQNMQRNILCKIKNGQKNSREKELKKQKSGIKQKKEDYGTKNMEKEHGIIESLKDIDAYNVEMNIKQDMEEYQNTVIRTARLRHFVKGESYIENVYDLTVDNTHEYFANGILVHNCMDALRYGLESIKAVIPKKITDFGGVKPFYAELGI